MSRTKVSQSKVLEYSRKWHGDRARVEPQVGSVILLDNKQISEKLEPGDDTVVPGFDGCDFRYPNPIFADRGIACNVEITGRKIVYRNGALWVRVKIEWVGDCEPSSYTRGWMFVDKENTVEKF